MKCVILTHALPHISWILLFIYIFVIKQLACKSKYFINLVFINYILEKIEHFCMAYAWIFKPFHFLVEQGNHYVEVVIKDCFARFNVLVV